MWNTRTMQTGLIQHASLASAVRAAAAECGAGGAHHGAAGSAAPAGGAAAADPVPHAPAARQRGLAPLAAVPLMCAFE